jgi:hypothetical protein
LTGEVAFPLKNRGISILRAWRGVLAKRKEYVTQKWHHTPMFLPSARISWPRTLGGLLVVLSLLGACGEADAPAGIGTRAVVIGIDGADWRVIDAIAAHGKLPHLSGLRARGTSGPIQTVADIALSPVIWTSVATGKTAAKHGISWFLVDQPDGTRVPVRSYNRKTKAIWNLLAEQDRLPIVVGWWATYLRKGRNQDAYLELPAGKASLPAQLGRATRARGVARGFRRFRRGAQVPKRGTRSRWRSRTG